MGRLCGERAFATIRNMQTALVVPCYNEAERLPAGAFEAFLRDRSDFWLIFVDDGSTDRTPERLLEVAAAAPERVEIVTLPANVGKAEAVRAGLLRALELDPAYVGYWDADLATPLPAVIEFRSLMERRPQVDLVLGARVVLLGRRIQRRALRHYLGRVAATLVASALGMRVYDTQCGAKLFRVTPGLRELFAKPFRARWLFDVEILGRLIAQRGGPGAAAKVIVESPLEVWTDVPGSKVSLGDYVRACLDLLRIRRGLKTQAGEPRRAR